ncbi:MAG: hypothetical protein HZB33_10345 [Nitrospirae bacterium]|nr:hypothetical protein [Nitrospirota bacterium]
MKRQCNIFLLLVLLIVIAFRAFGAAIVMPPSADVDPAGDGLHLTRQWSGVLTNGGPQVTGPQKDLKVMTEQPERSGKAKKLMLYNGYTPSAYSIGMATSLDGVTWTKAKNNPIISPSTGWKSTHVKDQWLIKVKDLYMLYYAAMGSQWNIGLATSLDGITWTDYSGNPIITGAGYNFPTVIHDPDEPDATQRYKMWYAYLGGASGTAIYYAYSSDGYTWTAYSGNPVLRTGSAGQWDALYIVTGPVYKSGSAWNLYYAGANSGINWGMGLATFTNPKSTYAKSGNNPLVTRRASATGTLTADILAGSKTVTVADTSVFQVNEPVVIYDADSSWMTNRIFSMDSSTQITLRDAVTADFTTAQNAIIRSIYYDSVYPRSMSAENGVYTMYGTCFKPLADKALSFPELSCIFTSSALDSGWSIDINKGVLLPLSSSGFDTQSAENPCVMATTDE